MTRKRIGEVLRDEGLITEEELQSALEAQAHQGRPLGEILIEETAVTEEDVARVIARQHGLPFIDPNRYEPDESLRDIFPEAALVKYRFVPLDVFDESLVIVISGPLDTEVLEEIEGLAGKRLHVMVGTVSDVRKAQADRYHTASERLTGLGSLLLGEEEPGAASS
jgi:type IV pilus assembly protein PilB